MNDELEKLRPEVREAVVAIDCGNGVFVNSDDGIGSAKWKVIRAELLRLTDDCARLVDCINAQPPTRRSLIDRAECAEAELAALKTRIDGSRQAFLDPNMDRITFLAEDIGPVGKYALVKVED